MKVLKIKDIVRTISITHKFDKDKLIAINTSDVENGIMHDGTLTAIEDLKGQFKKTVQKGDILFSEIRPANRRFALVTKDDCADYVVSTKLMVLRKYNNEVDLRYFYYCLTNQPFLDMLQRKAENRIGSFPQITFDLLSEYAFPVPSLSEQERIANIIFSLDHKIKLNKQINDNLEVMAKQLYDYWFVQFDFPNEDGKPYKSSGGAMVWNEKLKREIPTFFDVKSLSEIIEVKDGTHDSPKPQDNGYFLLTSKHLTERGLDYASAYKISKEDYESINKRSKVDTNDILFSMIGTIGNSYFVEETNINFAIKNMALFKTSAKRWFSEYLYLYLSSCDYKHYEGNSLSGSIQKFVSLRTLRDMPILYHEDIIKVFAKEVRNIITMMVNLRKENIELTKQRDELLPLLMNGQASVNYHLSASSSISFDISVLFLNFTNGKSLYETICLDYQRFALPLHSKENTHGTIQEDKRHIQQRQRQGNKHAKERFLAFFNKCTSTIHQAAFGNAWCYRGYKGKVISESK